MTALDARRSWFRHHQLFADLLQLELRQRPSRTARAARRRRMGWRPDHGYPVEAVRHAQAAQDWGLAARLLADHWVGLGLNGLGATAYELLAPVPGRSDRWGRRTGRPDGLARAGTGIAGGGRTVRGSRRRGTGLGARGPARALAGGTRCGAVAGRPPARGPPGRGRAGVPAAGPAGDADPARLGVGVDLRALALMSLGVAKVWTG